MDADRLDCAIQPADPPRGVSRCAMSLMSIQADAPAHRNQASSLTEGRSDGHRRPDSRRGHRERGRRPAARSCRVRARIACAWQAPEANLTTPLPPRPCSIHDPEQAITYARKLKEYAEAAKEDLCILMRVYFEK